MKIGICLILLTTSVLSQQPPKKVKETPRAYSQPLDSMSIVKQDVVPQLPWKVYSDRDNNTTVMTPDPSASPSGKTMSFLEQVWVTDETDQYVRIARGNPKMLQLDESSEDLYWIEKSKMLLWTRSLSTNQGKIPKKVMILNTIEHLRKSAQDKGSPDKLEFTFAPYDGAKKNGNTSDLFEFFFVLKREGKYVLLSRNERLVDNYQERLLQVVGWAHESRLTFWDNRVSIEPNWENAARLERKNRMLYAIAVEKEKEAKDIFNNVYKGTPLWKEGLSTLENRPVGEWRRFPLISLIQTQTQIYRVGIMGSIYDQYGEIVEAENGSVDNAETVARITKDLDDGISDIRNINIMFIVDGSSSMGPYFSATRDAVAQTLRQIGDNRNIIKYGVAIYRDYSENERKFELLPLQSSPDAVISFLEPSKAKDYHDNDAPEALFYGMLRGIRESGLNSSHNNLIILIGDAGSHNRNDVTNVSISDVKKNLLAMNASLIAFQVNNDGGLTHKEFGDQLKTLVTSVSNSEFTKSNDPNEAIIVNSANLYSIITLSKNMKMDPKKLTTEVAKFIRMQNEFVNNTVRVVEKAKAGGNIDEGVSEAVKELSIKYDKYVDNFKASLNYFLQKAGLSKSDVAFLKKEKFQLFLPGYVCLSPTTTKYKMFKKVLFLTSDELYDVKNAIFTLVERGSSREDFLEAWKKVIKTYIGNPSDIEMERYSLSDWQEKLIGLPSASPILKQVRISDIPNRNKFPDNDMQEIIAVMKAKANELEKIYRMPTGSDNRYKYSFRSNEQNYYWIDEDLIP